MQVGQRSRPASTHVGAATAVRSPFQTVRFVGFPSGAEAGTNGLVFLARPDIFRLTETKR